MTVPSDASLPQAAALLDLETMAPVLAWSLGRPARLESLRAARITYRPGVRVAVHYEVRVDGRPANAVASALAGRDLRARAARPRLFEVARRVDGRSPARTPIVYAPSLDVLITWLPFDPRLPALGEAPGALAERLERAGVPGCPTTEPTMVPESYKPGSRAVLRYGSHILKAYGKERSYERGVAGFRFGTRTALGTAELEASFADLRLTVQTAVDGKTPTPLAAAERAGRLVRRLQSAEVESARAVTPDSVLALASEKASLVTHILPALRRPTARVLERLHESAPTTSQPVPAHGDFDADQIVETASGDYVIIDFDDACVAAPAFDLATYLADVAAGDADDLAEIEAVRAPLLAGYGGSPGALDWYLAACVLSRAPWHFQRLSPRWPERVAGMVRTAEEVLAR